MWPDRLGLESHMVAFVFFLFLPTISWFFSCEQYFFLLLILFRLGEVYKVFRFFLFFSAKNISFFLANIISFLFFSLPTIFRFPFFSANNILFAGQLISKGPLGHDIAINLTTTVLFFFFSFFEKEYFRHFFFF